MDDIYNQIKTLSKKYSVTKVVLFGSRARKDNTDRSDIDLAIYGVEGINQSQFLFDIDEIDTLLQFDVVFIDSNTSKQLIKNIQKDGVVLYAKM